MNGDRGGWKSIFFFLFFFFHWSSVNQSRSNSVLMFVEGEKLTGGVLVPLRTDFHDRYRAGKPPQIRYEMISIFVSDFKKWAPLRTILGAKGRIATAILSCRACYDRVSVLVPMRRHRSLRTTGAKFGTEMIYDRLLHPTAVAVSL